jgi:pyruvate dehydrogenase E2 component (dihydrolipoamide acetyltransferase)
MNSAALADFRMPALGADMETGRVVQWNVKAGDRVKKGDVVCVVETHKGAIDVEIFLDGTIETLAPLHEDLKVGAVLAQVRNAEAPAPAAAPALALAPARPAIGARARVSPAARRRAAGLGMSPDALSGSGGDGAVVLADVERAAAAASAAPPRPRSGFDPAQMRQAIAAAMARSKREIPHYYLGATIDFAAASRWVDDHNRDRPPAERLLPAVLLLKAAAKALVQVPQLNGFWVDGAFRPAAGVHVGWAVALRGGGLVAPALHDADRQALPALMTALRDLVQRARAGGLRSSEMTDPTVTVTSLGDRGAESVLGVIYPPQVALIGFGRPALRPWVVDGAVVARPLVAATLAADHRASDGHLGGQLLAAIDAALQSPETL